MNRQPPPCGHYECRQNYIDTGDGACCVVSDAVRNFVNGNRSDVRDAIYSMPPLDAAAFAVRVYHDLGNAERIHFLRWIEAMP